MAVCLWELSTLWRNSRHQLHALFCGLVLGGGNVGDPPFISVLIFLSVHAHLSLLNLPLSFIQRVVEISPKEDFWVYLKEVAFHTY